MYSREQIYSLVIVVCLLCFLLLFKVLCTNWTVLVLTYNIYLRTKIDEYGYDAF